MNDPLLPCPFCGGQAQTEYLSSRKQWFAVCANGSCRSSSANWSTEKRAIKEWNHRTPPPASMKCEHIWCTYSFHRHCHKCGRQESLPACKELNAVKGEAAKYTCYWCDESGGHELVSQQQDCDKRRTEFNKKTESCEHDWNETMVGDKCIKCGKFKHQPSEKNESPLTPYGEEMVEELAGRLAICAQMNNYKMMAAYLINAGWSKKEGKDG